MKKRIIEALLFLKPEGLTFEEIKTFGVENIEELEKHFNDQYKEFAFYVKRENERLVMTIKPTYIPQVRKYFQQRDLTKSQLKLLGIVKTEKKISKAEASRKFKSTEIDDLINRGFLKIVKQNKRSYLVIGPYYKEYFGDV